MNKQPSKYQSAIYSFVKNPIEGNGAINATAGSGKTSTAVEALNHIPRTASVQFNCFGRDIATELKTRVGHLFNVNISTYNAMGWTACRQKFGYIVLADGKKLDKTDDILRCRVLNVHNEEDKKLYYKFRFNIKKLVSLCKGAACLTTGDAGVKLFELIDYHCIDVSAKDLRRFVQIFGDVYEHSINQTKVMDFDDQIYFPIKYNLPLQKGLDFLFIDEFQDSNQIQYELVKRLGAERTIAIGDEDQSIYSFRGTAPNILQIFKRDFEAQELPLNICYRCSKNVVKNAQQYVPRIESFEHNPEGLVEYGLNYQKFKELANPNTDIVVCRVTAPLIKSCLDFLTEGKAAFVVGKEIKDQLVQMINKISKQDEQMSSILFNDLLREYRTEQVEELEKLDRQTAIETLENLTDALFVLIPGSGTVAGLKRKIDNLFNQTDGGIKHMSIHKSKGLESLNVFSLPYKQRKLKREWMISEERRIAYVESTRAKLNHYYVREEK